MDLDTYIGQMTYLKNGHFSTGSPIDRSGVSKKSSSSNSGQELSVDTDATIAKHHTNIIESVHDGNNELLSNVSSSATFSTRETTASHLNESRQNIVVDGKMYRCNNVKVFGEKKNIVYVKYLQCGMALDVADGLKWKPYSKGKATSSSEKIRCYGTLRAEFSKLRRKEISHSTQQARHISATILLHCLDPFLKHVFRSCWFSRVHRGIF